MLNRLRAVIRHRLSVSSPEASLPAIQRWFLTAWGRAVLAREQRDIDEALNCRFGYHLCQLTVSPTLDLAASSRISHNFGLTPLAASGVAGQARCDYRRLPLAPESVDVIILHHALDFSQTPHQLLAEATRALIPRGHLVIVGFNPVSLLGFWQGLLRWSSGRPHWRRQALRVGRLMDWLALLDLEPVTCRQGYFVPGSGCEVGAVERLLRHVKSPLGGYYVLTVRKDVSAVTPIRPKWQAPALSAVRGVGLSGGARSHKTRNNIDK
ncbi:MAG TPA: methyltransferase domain-containing protein [Cellvibrionaceae bacterium]